MTRKIAFLAAIPLAVAAVVLPSVASSADDSNKTVLKFDVMSPVIEPFTAPEHAIRGVAGGGLPWEIDRGQGSLRADGLLKISVKGLVLARRAPVPAERQGTNPLAQFAASVNCLTPASPDTGETVATAPVDATPSGTAFIKQKIALPENCVAPIVFVTSAGGAWLAASGH